MLFLGAHLSSSNGFEAMGKTALQIGAVATKEKWYLIEKYN